MNHDDLIGRLATVTDDEAARMVSPETRAHLAEQIMATVPARPRRRRALFLVGLPLAAAATGAAVIATVGNRHHDDVRLAALTFSTQGKYVIVTVKDPYADPKRYAKEFAAHGMKIQLRMVPVSPSIVGTVVFMDGGEGIRTITANGKCWTGGGGFSCPVGVKIPVGYHGEAGISFGRPARPGEKYTSTTSAYAPGEELHCVDIRRRTVGQVLTMLRRHKVSVAMFNYDLRPGYATGTTDARKIPRTWYVGGAEPYAPGQVMLSVGPRKPGPAEDDAYYKQLFKGCR